MANVGNWVGELTSTKGQGDIQLGGALSGFAKFNDAIPDGEVWYVIIDEHGNTNQKEAGVGTLSGINLVRTTIHSTLINGVFNDQSPSAINLTGFANVYCTFNKTAFDDIQSGLVDLEQMITDVEANALWLSGGNNKMGQGIDMDNNRITKLPPPVAGHEAARYQDVLDITLSRVSEEQKVLADGQTEVAFVSVPVTDAAIYIGGGSGDRGRLYRGVDYTITSGFVIELVDSYPSGTVCLCVNNEKISATMDNVNELIDTSGIGAVVWMGIDSLTAGAGGVTYNLPFEKFVRGAVGWAGRWIPFQPSPTFGETTDGFKTGQSDIATTLPRSDFRRAMSFDGKGTYAPGDGTRFTYEVIPNFNWSSADIYYLQQPGGGSVIVDYPQDIGSPTIDTSGTLSIQKVTISQRKKATASSSQVLRLNNLALSGDVTFYGIVFHSGDKGVTFLNAATGGQTAQEFTEYTHQSEWFSLMGVTHAINCAGMNDRATRSAIEFEADLRALSARFDSSVSQYIVKPNEPDSGISIYDAVYPAVATDFGELIDLQALYGDYATVSAAGQMFDGVHTNEHYQYYQSQHYCTTLFNKSQYMETPPIIDYSASDTQALIEGSFKSVLGRLSALEP